MFTPNDPSYILQAIRLSTLRASDDSLTPRIVSLDPSFALNPYINASGLSDVDRWPEIKRALDSPPLDPVDRPRRRVSDENRAGGGGLNYTQTIMGGRSGALGMRVSGRAGGRAERKEGRANSSSAVDPPSPIAEMPSRSGLPTTDGFFSPSGRPRSDSAPVPKILHNPMSGMSVITTGRGMGGGLGGTGLLGRTLSASETSEAVEAEEEDHGSAIGAAFMEETPASGAAMSARPLNLNIESADGGGMLGTPLVDEGSDIDEDEIEEEGDLDEDTRELPDPAKGKRSSLHPDTEELVFEPVPVPARRSVSGPSALTALLNKHVPHLVSTSAAPEDGDAAASNPFASLYASVAAMSNIPSISLELYFPHSESPTTPLMVKVRKDATVEEVTGYGLYKYWEDSRHPLLSEQESETMWSTVGWGLRIVEDDGEVDEDFPRKCSCLEDGPPGAGASSVVVRFHSRSGMLREWRDVP
jgi:hypothetical protein